MVFMPNSNKVNNNNNNNQHFVFIQIIFQINIRIEVAKLIFNNNMLSIVFLNKTNPGSIFRTFQAKHYFGKRVFQKIGIILASSLAEDDRAVAIFKVMWT